MTEDEKHVCTECGGDAFIAYSASKKAGDWGGKVKIGENICTKCFKKRTGIKFF